MNLIVFYVVEPIEQIGIKIDRLKLLVQPTETL